MLKEKLKKTFKKNSLIAGTYDNFVFLKNIPLKDLLDIRHGTEKIALIRIVKPYSMLSYPRLSKIYDLSAYLEKNKIEGSFVECGAWNGGSAAIMAVIAKDNKKRRIWLLDSWKGLPPPGQYDIDYNGASGWEGMATGSKNAAEEVLFEKLKLGREKIRLAEGWFHETLPRHKNDFGKIALLHIDCDFYEPVKLCLETLYDRVASGGFIVIDDYGYWKGCKKAIDEFLEAKQIKANLIKIDQTGVYFQKP